jgi:DNA-directed RNA polymerase subunit L
MNTSFDNFDKSERDTIKFDVSKCNSSFVNSLRRIIISEIETAGFRTEEYEKSDIKVIENNSSLHNEFLLHRFGLIPVHTEDVEKYDPSKYKFILNVQHSGTKSIDVTTKDIKILNLESNINENNESFFPKNPITNDYILITRLKPTPDGIGEKINMEGTSSKGIGKEHIRFSPVSNVCFINKIDPVRLEEEFKKYIAEDGVSVSAELKSKFMIEESERCYHIDYNGDPDIFEFTIESCGVMLPQNILLEGLKQMIIKLKKFIDEFSKSMSSQESTIEIRKSKVLMKAFDVIINGENHTLGHLLQSHINKLFKEKNIFVGYMNPHPLEDKIIFRVNVENIKALKEVFTQTCDELIKQCDALSNIVLKEFKKNIIFKPISKSKAKPKASTKDNSGGPDNENNSDTIVPGSDISVISTDGKGTSKGKGKGKAKVSQNEH